MNKTVETIRSRLSIDDEGAISAESTSPTESEVSAEDQSAVSGNPTTTEEAIEEQAEASESAQALSIVSVSPEKPVKANKKLVETKALPVYNYPYPKNWIPEGATEMSKDNIATLSEERVIDARKRTQEPTVITLPTTEKNVSESFSDVSVDPVAERISTVIAVNCTNTGDIKSKDGVMIQGVQVGNISIDADDLDPTGTIVVTKAGTVRGQIEGKRVVVLGRVEGSIKSYTHVTLGESAVVTGDVEYKTIRMMDGAEIEGNCRKLKIEA